MGEIHMAKCAAGAAQKYSCLDPTRSGRGHKVAQGKLRPAKSIQRSLFAIVAGAGVEFGCHDRRQDSALEDTGIFAYPLVAVTAAEAYVDAGVEEKPTGWQ